MVVKHSFYEMCDYFEFLDELRSSGTTNMFGAASELAKEHSLQIADARDVLSYWMKTFGNGVLEDRVSEAQIARRESTNVVT